MDVPVLKVERRWHCPSCGSDHVTNRGDAHTPMHNCRGLFGLSVPFIDAAHRGTNRINEREDYLGTSIGTRLPDGRLPMNVTTDRDDGQDVTVYPPCAVMRIGAIDPDGPIAALIGSATQQERSSNGVDR